MMFRYLETKARDMMDQMDQELFCLITMLPETKKTQQEKLEQQDGRMNYFIL